MGVDHAVVAAVTEIRLMANVAKPMIRHCKARVPPMTGSRYFKSVAETSSSMVRRLSLVHQRDNRTRIAQLVVIATVFRPLVPQ